MVVVLVVDVVVVDGTTVVVVPEPNLADGDTMFAMAGSAVVLSMIPTTRDPTEPMRTERRGPRRKGENRPVGSPESFCPCVILVMDQLSKTKSKVASTRPQNCLNSNEVVPRQEILEDRTWGCPWRSLANPKSAI